jgi:hypothetical protein
LERSNLGLIEIPSWNFPGGIEENHENSVRIAGVPAEIQLKDLLNANLECYH